MILVFKRLVISQIVLTCFWYFFPWRYFYVGELYDALLWLGAGSPLDDSVRGAIGYVLMGLYFSAYIGVIFYKNWARWLLLSLSIVGGLFIPIYGLLVQLGFEYMVGYFMTLIDGVILTMCFLSRLKTKFRSSKKIR